MDARGGRACEHLQGGTRVRMGGGKAGRGVGGRPCAANPALRLWEALSLSSHPSPADPLGTPWGPPRPPSEQGTALLAPPTGRGFLRRNQSPRLLRTR